MRNAFPLAVAILLALPNARSVCAEDEKSVAKDTGIPEPFEKAFRDLVTEIETAAEEKPTHVAWLIDQSNSMSVMRKHLAETIGKLDSKLAAVSSSTLVAAFGSSFTMLTPEPVHGPMSIAESISAIDKDNSGKENCLSGVLALGRAFRKTGERNDHRILIIATDEAGDDFMAVEDAATLCSKMGIRVFCLGNVSPFGTRRGYVSRTYDDGYVERIPIDQGPETIWRMVPDWPSTTVPEIAFSRISSGFGPWALERLCRATGGRYLIAKDDMEIRFDAEVMSKYEPDYTSWNSEKRREQFPFQPLHNAVITAGALSGQNSLRIPFPFMRADTADRLRSDITMSQRSCLSTEYVAKKVLLILDSVEPGKEEVVSPRTQASYDLSIGRALAIQIRALQFNHLLAERKGDALLPKPPDNTWQLVAAKTVDDNPAIEKQIAKAEQHLQKVVREHEGTPFAYVAKKELERGFGWSWTSHRVDYPEAIPRRGFDKSYKMTTDLLLRLGPDGKPTATRRRLVRRERPKL